MAHKMFKEDYRKKMLRQAASGQVNFAYGRAEGGESDVFVCDKSIEPAELFKRIRREYRYVRKGTWGTAEVAGKSLVMICDNPFPGLKKKFKRFAKEAGLKQTKCKILQPDGSKFLDTEDSDATPSSTEQSAAESAAANLASELARVEKLAADWSQGLAAAKGQIEQLRLALAKQPAPAVKKVHRALAGVDRHFPEVDFSQVLAAARANDRSGYDAARANAGKAASAAQAGLPRDKVLSKIDANPLTATTVTTSLADTLGQVAAGLLG